MTNPYLPTPHQHQHQHQHPHPHAAPQDAPSQLARVLLVGLCIGIGAIAAIMVYVGDAFQWPHFNRRAGFFGTESNFLRGLLYAINDPYAIHIVAFIWFLYGSIVTGTIVFLYRVLYLKRNRKAL
ncbi:hypothetical protein N9D23_06445 [Rubripirellula sp.]|nr:hypothetical protein [Rubripirellula sp.]